MVKITDPNEDKNEPTNTGSTNYEVELTDDIIKDMLKAENKQSTTALNIRLETNITDQIELYANEHNTTKTEVIKKILAEHYSNKKITKGTFKLKEPVTLIIPRSKELLTEYMKKEVNIITTIQHNGATINPLDPQVELYNMGEGAYSLKTLTHVNNILDMYNEETESYTFTSKWKEDTGGEIQKIIEAGFLPVLNFQERLIIYHRGLLYINIIDNEEVTPLLIDVLCVDNDLVRAIIIDHKRAKQLARITHNNYLIDYLNKTEKYINISEMVFYDKTNKKLQEENKNIMEVAKHLQKKYDDLKKEVEAEKEFSRIEDNNKYTKEEKNYIDQLKHENRQLRTKINEYKEKDRRINRQLNKLEDMLNEYTPLD